jgi:hypothetical protein
MQTLCPRTHTFLKSWVTAIEIMPLQGGAARLVAEGGTHRHVYVSDAYGGFLSGGIGFAELQ